jgi:hypothetical protein
MANINDRAGSRAMRRPQAEISEGVYHGKIALTIAKAEARGGLPGAMANTGFTVS